MNTIIAYLKQLELSEIEAKLYLTLLQSGPISVRDLASAIDMKRTTAYLYIDQLIEKGLVLRLVKGSKKLVAAENPESLQHLVDAKIISAKAIQKNFPEILKTISSTLTQGKDVDEAEVKYYKGTNGVKKIYEEALSGNEFRSYVKLEEHDSPFPEDIDLFAASLKKNDSLVIKEIFYNSPLLKDQAPHILSKNERYSFKLMPTDLKLTSGDILIYKDKVAIINYNNNISSVVLQNTDFYNTLKELFDFIWKVIP